MAAPTTEKRKRTTAHDLIGKSICEYFVVVDKKRRNRSRKAMAESAAAWLARNARPANSEPLPF